MPADNTIYERPGDLWWGEDAPLAAIRTALNPGRMEYFARVCEELGMETAGKAVIDIGCGGGLLAEQLARLGCRVTGVDPSEASLAVARVHAVREGLEITYVRSDGEALPFADAAFDIAVCCDVLEHVHDLEQVISETSRVLMPGGLYMYDTINRTLRSRVVVIQLLQEWAWTRLVPPDLHDWRQFIRPSELVDVMRSHGLRGLGYTGLRPRAGPVALLRLLRERKRGRLTQAALGAQAVMTQSRDTSILYIGHAVKTTPGRLSPAPPRSSPRRRRRGAAPRVWRSCRPPAGTSP
ncbi:MAG: bifunctional 2-polyprenyl-6-hydroxyphenol methylase/3-demethylubiquinol 3-O-methyltransferase UbiG [Candidatus Dormibacteraeota bacterium]|nr:bifunctional 2-polyprenyl-6-hydroxyphenol methylase/3-demethylubiquinol 3-O-methyltransferase UbiG [Candidatus Dormibacteraeota bacterium]